jgi:hypothetical protein
MNKFAARKQTLAAESGIYRALLARDLGRNTAEIRGAIARAKRAAELVTLASVLATAARVFVSGRGAAPGEISWAGLLLQAGRRIWRDLSSRQNS